MGDVKDTTIDAKPTPCTENSIVPQCSTIETLCAPLYFLDDTPIRSVCRTMNQTNSKLCSESRAVNPETGRGHSSPRSCALSPSRAAIRAVLADQGDNASRPGDSMRGAA